MKVAAAAKKETTETLDVIGSYFGDWYLVSALRETKELDTIKLL
ncbi:hypothetical protein PR003_g26481, partial [Phytophthora rubi]